MALSAPKPRIGITTYRQRGQTGVWDVEMGMIPAFYIEAITRAGGVVVLLPPQQLTSTDAENILSSLDGLMISGGRDVDATRYGQAPHEKSEEPDKLRDHLEDQLINAAIKLQVPFLGICRGAQMLNVNRGGSLVQHLPDLVGDNRYQLGGGQFSFMDIKVQDGTKLLNLLGKEQVSNVALYHHQAIDEVGEGLRVSAVSEDGVIEAIELENHPFGVAVQWHPEQTLEDLTLFEALIEAAQKYRSSK